MKNKVLLIATLFLVAIAGLTSCVEPHSIRISTNNLWFGVEAETQTLDIKANCEWNITKNDDASWYTIDLMSGENDATLNITVETMEDADYRSSKFVISSPNGHVRRTIFISQNRLDFYAMYDKVYGVVEVEHWNTDFYGQIIEDSYKDYEYDPYDTATGYTMYFLGDGTGVQMDHHEDSAVFYPFIYDYNPAEQILHIEFETVDDAPENYDPQVLTASDSLYRFMHEWKPNWWERADMRKIGTINSNQKAWIKRAAAKRKGSGGVFQME